MTKLYGIIKILLVKDTFTEESKIMAHEKGYSKSSNKDPGYDKSDTGSSDMGYSGGDMKGSKSEKSYFRPMDSYGKHKDQY